MEATETEPRTPKTRRRPVDPRTIPTEYVGWVNYNNRSSVSVFGKTLPELLKDVFHYGAYYFGLHPESPVTVQVELQCATCHGTGQVYRRSLRRSVVQRKSMLCKACHGQGVLERFEPVALTVNDATTIKTL